MILPSDVCPPTSEEVGFFKIPVNQISEWLKQRLDAGRKSKWLIESPHHASLDELCELLRPLAATGVDRYLFIPLEEWTAVLNNAILGTDLGMIQSIAARDGMCLAIRAVAGRERPDAFAGTVLEVYDPTAPDLTLRLRRSISAIDDGRKWRFDQEGDPYPFESLDLYSRKSVRDRFTPDTLRD